MTALIVFLGQCLADQISRALFLGECDTLKMSAILMLHEHAYLGNQGQSWSVSLDLLGRAVPTRRQMLAS